MQKHCTGEQSLTFCEAPWATETLLEVLMPRSRDSVASIVAWMTLVQTCLSSNAPLCEERKHSATNLQLGLVPMAYVALVAAPHLHAGMYDQTYGISRLKARYTACLYGQMYLLANRAL